MPELFLSVDISIALTINAGPKIPFLVKYILSNNN